jgi:hypothetical protein
MSKWKILQEHVMAPKEEVAKFEGGKKVPMEDMEHGTLGIPRLESLVESVVARPVQRVLVVMHIGSHASKAPDTRDSKIYEHTTLVSAVPYESCNYFTPPQFVLFEKRLKQIISERPDREQLTTHDLLETGLLRELAADQRNKAAKGKWSSKDLVYTGYAPGRVMWTEPGTPLSNLWFTADDKDEPDAEAIHSLKAEYAEDGFKDVPMFSGINMFSGEKHGRRYSSSRPSKRWTLEDIVTAFNTQKKKLGIDGLLVIITHSCMQDEFDTEFADLVEGTYPPKHKATGKKITSAGRTYSMDGQSYSTVAEAMDTFKRRHGRSDESPIYLPPPAFVQVPTTSSHRRRVQRFKNMHSNPDDTLRGKIRTMKRLIKEQKQHPQWASDILDYAKRLEENPELEVNIPTPAERQQQQDRIDELRKEIRMLTRRSKFGGKRTRRKYRRKHE